MEASSFPSRPAAHVANQTPASSSGVSVVSRGRAFRNRTHEPQNVETVLGVFRDLGWQYAVGVATLLGGALVLYFFDPRETEEERIETPEAGR